MSHLAQATFNAAKIHAEAVIDNVLKRIAEMNVREEVKQKIRSDLQIQQLQNEVANTNYSMHDYQVINRLKTVENRANAFFSAVDTYIAYNFDLEITDYKTAISQIGDLLVGSSDTVVSKALETTDDELFRTYIIATSKQEKFADSDSLLKAAQTKMQGSKLYQKQAAKNAKTIFASKGISAEIKENESVTKAISKATQETNTAIVDKTVRNRVLSSIIKIIREQGFIVKKKNVEECGDHAKIYAIKPNGEQVNFAVYLDGKFIYKFHDYEGLSCEKDMGNFEEKFESIYGVKLEDKKILWSNPDRLGKMAHQTINPNKIGGTI
jgi:hypothetical protein